MRTIPLLLNILMGLRGGAGTSNQPDKAAAHYQSDESEDLPAAKAGQGETGPRATLGELIRQLDERAYGLLLLLLALPCCLPFVYLLPQIVALPMIAFCAQLAMGKRSPWLPKKLEARSFNIDSFESVVKRAERYIDWAEIFARPRLRFLSEGLGLRLMGAGLVIPCASILVPLPLTNTVPGISVAIAAIGLIERDGLLTVFGLICGLIWVGLLIFVGVEGIQLFKDFILER